MKTDLNKLRDRVYKFACNQAITRRIENDEYFMMVIIVDICDTVVYHRNYRHADVKSFNGHELDRSVFYFHFYDKYIKDSFEDKLSDIVIRLLFFAGLRNEDIGKLNSRLNVRNYKRLIPESDYDFTEYMFGMVGLWYEDMCLGDKICCCIGGMFALAYKYHIDLIQCIEWKIKYNELI